MQNLKPNLSEFLKGPLTLIRESRSFRAFKDLFMFLFFSSRQVLNICIYFDSSLDFFFIAIRSL